MDQSLGGPAPDRRALLKAAALGLFAFHVGGCQHMLTPAAARERP